MQIAIPVLTPSERLQSARDYMAELLDDAGISVSSVPVPDAISPSWVVLLRGDRQLVIAAFVRRSGGARFYGLFEKPGTEDLFGNASGAGFATGFASDDDPGACVARVIHALKR